MKRFYKDVMTGPAVGGGFVVLLDGRPVRTPAKALMNAPTEELAAAVAAEWAAQAESVIPETMPLTQYLTTAIDRVTAEREAIAKSALAYLDSDLLCYRADEPEALTEEQNKLWSPWLEWFGGRFGTWLEITFALTRLDQPAEARKAAQDAIQAMDLHEFTVFQAVTALTGSAVLGLAMAEGVLPADAAWRCALCEELFYERAHDLEKHGLDPIEEKRREALKRDLDAAARYLALTRSSRS